MIHPRISRRQTRHQIIRPFTGVSIRWRLLTQHRIPETHPHNAQRNQNHPQTHQRPTIFNRLIHLKHLRAKSIRAPTTSKKPPKGHRNTELNTPVYHKSPPNVNADPVKHYSRRNQGKHIVVPFLPSPMRPPTILPRSSSRLAVLAPHSAINPKGRHLLFQEEMPVPGSSPYFQSPAK